MTPTMSRQQQGDDHMVLFSQLYTGVYNPSAVPQQGESKPRRRRKKSKAAAAAGENGAVGFKKRKLSAEQVNLLELSFGNEHKLESERKDRLASELGLDPRQVAVWFQNRRARWKNKKLEEEYNKLKSVHENVVVEKCQLENEVLKLKEQLLNAEKKIQRLTEKNNNEGASSNSPSSSMTMEAVDPPFLGEFGVDVGDVFYMPAESSYINGMDWMNLYM